MPRSHINGNFIDKTSSIAANILLQIISTNSREKGHLLIIEMMRFDFFTLPISHSYEKERDSHIENNITMLGKAR
jgi:hypothetical protein